jgi:UDP-N-acetylglucosamine 3-dehydrogenase
MKINVAVAGVGTMGQNHARVYSELKETNLVAVADINQETGKSIANRFGCKFYNNFESLLDNETIDAVSIVVPTSYHRDIALLALKRGIAALVEKPLADTRDAALDIINTAQAQNTQLMVGHVERFNPAAAKLKQIVSQGQLGEIMSIISRRVGIAPPRIKDAGVIIDLGVHDIDICNYLLESLPDNIFASGGRALINSREDYAHIFLQYGKANVIIQVNWITPVKVRILNVTGTKGYAELDYMDQRLTLHQAKIDTTFDDYGDFIVKFGKPATKEAEVQKQEPLKLEIEHFVNCVQNSRKPLVSGEEGLAALEIALKAEQMCKKVRDYAK